ncbi:hypothetical protein E2562_033670 [Oryza meyeriana var. granulata]|uniref:Morc S5 domain-containing protein n=1 Tax=Oryza meyeriana var. granulata TaxID=110450 RepID=A0A6G1CA91_9ORYZ|nr:hypothetical protein E2562_033670 [Oryza meyeriana var. granulata]
MSMGAEKETKPFFSLITAIPRGLRTGFSACQLTPPTAAATPAAPLDQCGARGAAPGQKQAVAELPEGSGAGAGARSRRPGESPEDTTSARRPSCAAAARRISRRFWSAGQYEAAGGSASQPPPNVRNRMCVHPKFLHSNATSHKWPFGAVAELLDNAVDEIKTGATRIIVDKVVNSCNGSPALLVQVQQFQTTCFFSETTQSIGLLSYTFLAETGQKDVVVPLVDYKYNLLTGEAKPYHRLGADQFFSNLSDILISGAPKPAETSNAAKRMNESHLANQLRYSLRVYASILYLKLPAYFKIILRGQEVRDLYSHLIGYHKVPRAASGSPASRTLVATLSGTTATKSSERITVDPHVSAVPSRPNTCDIPSNAIPIAFAPHLVSAPAGRNAVAMGAPTSTMATGTNLADTRKRKMETLVQMDGPLKRQSKPDLAGENSVGSSNQVCQHMGERELNEFSHLKLENKLLRQECSEFELAERDLLLKVTFFML